ncbi:hypothetical protein CFP56_021659 [Quercus suber]|uniref:Uncharacterized protein n=1 Tax=Quercus suber TaxID=58331 RepID=A0AAW0KCS4_QUESU
MGIKITVALLALMVKGAVERDIFLGIISPWWWWWWLEGKVAHAYGLALYLLGGGGWRGKWCMPVGLVYVELLQLSEVNNLEMILARMIELMAPQPYCSKLSSLKLGSCFFSELQSDRGKLLKQAFQTPIFSAAFLLLRLLMGKLIRVIEIVWHARD